VSTGEVVVPDVAEAKLVTEPRSRSACVTVYVAVQVRDWVGAKIVFGQLTVTRSSVTVTGAVIDTFPVFVTR
jgi:hypothetical protein